MASSRSEENVNLHYFTNWWCHSYAETCNLWDIFCKSNLADVIANVYYLYGRCCCHLCLMLYHQSDVIDWWLVVMLPLLRFVWLILLPCGDVVTTCCVLFGWCYCQCCDCCYCHWSGLWQMLCHYHCTMNCLLLRHCCASGRCYCHSDLQLAGVIANGWCYCQVADVIATFDI